MNTSHENTKTRKEDFIARVLRNDTTMNAECQRPRFDKLTASRRLPALSLSKGELCVECRDLVTI
jgi:hypothetical protein